MLPTYVRLQSAWTTSLIHLPCHNFHIAIGLSNSEAIGWSDGTNSRFMQLKFSVNELCSLQEDNNRTYTYIHPFNGPLSGTTQVSRYQKVKPIWILLKQETVSSSGISWAIMSCSRQTTTPAPHHSVFLQAGCPSCRPTNSIKALKALTN